ncbi:hypothetical protein [Leptospira kmetyi]|uniref:ApeA N-terminal domain-containing protein n=1 Tax=Leptospira kmetyi TaxID=408139 RepID=A0ABX4N8F9_9LEPT|nr:hypothetical protein [Leptospira kmetyi]PJZ28377.1 hypothetical protein CH378_18030 [Leptospira kmetyi]
MKFPKIRNIEKFINFSYAQYGNSSMISIRNILSGTGILFVGTDQFDVYIQIDLYEAQISLFGDFLNSKFVDNKAFEYFVTANCKLKSVEIYSPVGTLHGDFEIVKIFSVRPRNNNKFNYSFVNRLINYEPHSSYDKLGIYLESSKIELNHSKLITFGKAVSFFQKIKNFILQDKTNFKNYNEIWFKGHKSWRFSPDPIIYKDLRLNIDCSEGYITVKSNKSIDDRSLQIIRAALSFYKGAELYSLFSINDSKVTLNLIDHEIKKGFTVVDVDHLENFLTAFLLYADRLSIDELEKFQNEIFLFAAGKSAHIYMNARLALLYITIESASSMDESIPLEQKILKLFNLDNPQLFNYSQHTISNSMKSDTASSLAKIRNAIMHEGMMSEMLYAHFNNHKSKNLKDNNILQLCKNDAHGLWLFIIANMDKYFLNLIGYRGEYHDASDYFRKKKTKI